MSFKRTVFWGVAAGVVVGGLSFLAACSAERQSCLHLVASALQWPAFALIEWLAHKLHGSADAGLNYLVPVVSLYWLIAGFTGGCLTWALRSLGGGLHPQKDT